MNKPKLYYFRADGGVADTFLFFTEQEFKDLDDGDRGEHTWWAVRADAIQLEAPTTPPAFKLHYEGV